MRTREEQIADLENQFGEEGTFTFVDDRDAATKHILEAEQRGYERARAECAADTRRLDWMVNRSIRIENGFGEPCPRTVLDSCDDILARSVGDFRPAIDAAMEGGK